MKLVEPFAIVCIAASTLAFTAAAQAQAAVNVPMPIVPEQAYPGDHVAVPLLGGGFCNAAHPDPASPPTIRMTEHQVGWGTPDSYRYEVAYALRETPDILCGVPPGPPVFYANVGELPRGYHYFDVTGTVEGEAYVSYSTGWVLVAEHDRPADDISGIWYAPEQSGRGFTVQRSGRMFVMYWATHDGDGEPTWATLIVPDIYDDDDTSQNTFSGTAITTSGAPLSAVPSALAAQPWAEVTFTYRGCGRATFEWRPLAQGQGQPAASGPDAGGSLALRQVLVPDGVEQCDAAVRSGGLVAEWIEGR